MYVSMYKHHQMFVPTDWRQLAEHFRLLSTPIDIALVNSGTCCCGVSLFTSTWLEQQLTPVSHVPPNVRVYTELNDIAMLSD